MQVMGASFKSCIAFTFLDTVRVKVGKRCLSFFVFLLQNFETFGWKPSDHDLSLSLCPSASGGARTRGRLHQRGCSTSAHIRSSKLDLGHQRRRDEFHFCPGELPGLRWNQDRARRDSSRTEKEETNYSEVKFRVRARNNEVQELSSKPASRTYYVYKHIIHA